MIRRRRARKSTFLSILFTHRGAPAQPAANWQGATLRVVLAYYSSLVACDISTPLRRRATNVKFSFSSAPKIAPLSNSLTNEPAKMYTLNTCGFSKLVSFSIPFHSPLLLLNLPPPFPLSFTRRLRRTPPPPSPSRRTETQSFRGTKKERGGENGGPGERRRGRRSGGCRRASGACPTR